MKTSNKKIFEMDKGKGKKTKVTETNESIDLKVAIYKEIGTNYRFFLKWRYATFLGNFVILGAVLSLTLEKYEEPSKLTYLIPLCGSPLSLILLLLDIRTSRLFQAAYVAGKKLEGKYIGYFGYTTNELRVTKSDPKRRWALTHSKIIWSIYVLSSITMLLLSLLLRSRWLPK